MAIRNFKATTNGRRKMSTLINTEITVLIKVLILRLPLVVDVR